MVPVVGLHETEVTMSLLLFHRTTKKAAARIERRGFRDTTGHYMMPIPMTGVWFSDFPVTAGEGAKQDEDDGGVLFEVALDLTEQDIAQYEVVEDEGPEPPFRFREWCLPAALVNAKGTLRRVPFEEEVAIDPWQKFRGEKLTAPAAVAWRRSRGFQSGGLSYFEMFAQYKKPEGI